MTIKWTRWDKEVIRKKHGDVYFYRDLYDGKHAKLFPRAKALAEEGEIISDLMEISKTGKVTRNKVPYIIANVSKLIPEIPAMLVSRAIGRVSPANDMDHPPEVQELQRQILEEIEENSNLAFEHYTNILQHQIDGGLVGVVMKDADDIPVIEMKARDVYFPHDDGRGADIALEEEYENEEGELESYLHIYRERIERSKERDPETKKRKSKLIVQHFLYKIEDDGSLTEVDEEEAKEKLGLEELTTEYPNRSRGFIEYWANNKTFNDPLGRSALAGQESKQEEINWTLTRSAIVFERNGKPRIAVTKGIMKKLQDIAYDTYGDENKIDARNLEIVQMDENGKAIEVIQIDVSKIGNIEWVKDLMKLMFVETQTSEKAVDFYLEGGSSGGAISGVAKFYDLFTSIVKAEKLAKEYIRFLQNLFESALWLERELGDLPDLPVEKPDIALLDMIPISRRELLEQEALAFEKGIQSRYETVKRIKPNDSEASIEDEVALIESEKLSDDSTSLARGRRTLSNLLDNRDTPLVSGGGEAGAAGTGENQDNTDQEE